MRGAAFALLIALAAPAGAAPPRAGLLWAQTALPRSLPLQVKTAPGADYYLVLRDASSGADVLGAYLHGGAFFRVLVPPGRYALKFARGPGADWAGEGALFGPATESFALEAPLDFAVTGTARKGGQIVDLREPGAISVRPVGICQARSPARDDRLKPSPGVETGPPFTAPAMILRARICD